MRRLWLRVLSWPGNEAGIGTRLYWATDINYAFCVTMDNLLEIYSTSWYCEVMDEI